MRKLIQWSMALLVALALAPARAAYNDNGDGTVTDSVTGLTWMRCAMGQTWDGTTCTGTASIYTLDEAKALTHTFAGQSDWRLPNVRELQSLVDRSRYNPAIDATAFPATPSSSFWSVPASTGVSGVDFYTGYVGSIGGTVKNVRLVRGALSSALLSVGRADADYTDNGNGQVMHNPTGLIWKKCVEGQTWTGSGCSGMAAKYSWDQAKGLTSDFGGKSDWRLPTEEELLSLVNYAAVNWLSINSAMFSTPQGWLWSASPSAEYPSAAWSVLFDLPENGGRPGTGTYINRNFTLYARLVRKAQTSGSLVVPDAPVIGKAAAGNAFVTVAFTPPANNGGAAIFNYTATCGSVVATGTSSPITVSGLTNGVAADCTVRATNSVGIGAASASSNSVTPNVGLGAAPGHTYTDNGDGTVTDSVTGLTWMRCAMGQTWTGSGCDGGGTQYSWSDAMALTYVFAGKSDWRVPNIRELLTLADLSRSDPAIDATVFPNMPVAGFWSSSTVVTGYINYRDNVWSVNFQTNGATTARNKASTGSIRLVRGGKSSALLSDSRPDTNYTDNDDGTVTDKSTGLMWKRCVEGTTWNGFVCAGTAGKYSWNQAKSLTSSQAGQSDWRLPTQEELVSLLEFAKETNNRINTVMFYGDVYNVGGYWSSTPVASSPIGAWYSGYESSIYTNVALRSDVTMGARLVRGGRFSVPLVPGAPVINAVNADDRKLIVDFTPSPYNGGVEVSGFTAACGSQTATGTASPITVTGLTNGTATTCSVTATNSVGTSPASAASSSVTPNVPTTTTTTTTTTSTTTTTTTTLAGSSISLAAGWNLMGNGTDGAFAVASVFNDANKVTTVWKWIVAKAGWAFYTPTQADGGLAYATSKGYDFLTDIGAGEGFWVNTKQAFSVSPPAGNALTVGYFQTRLPAGWNLIAIGEAKTPRQFNDGLSITPPSPGASVVANLTTLWAWDAGQSAWYFYAPGLEGSGTLSSYVAGKGYLDFTAQGKLLGNGTGFWVNRPQ